MLKSFHFDFVALITLLRISKVFKFYTYLLIYTFPYGYMKEELKNKQISDRILYKTPNTGLKLPTGYLILRNNNNNRQI